MALAVGGPKISLGGELVSVSAGVIRSVCHDGSLLYAEEREVPWQWCDIYNSGDWQLPEERVVMKIVVGPTLTRVISNGVSPLSGGKSLSGDQLGKTLGAEARSADVKQVFEICGASEEVRWVRAAEIDELTRTTGQLVGAMGHLAKVVDDMAVQGGFIQRRRRRHGLRDQKHFRFNNQDRCFQCNADDHNFADCPEVNFKNAGRCFLCDSPEHYQDSCPQNQIESAGSDRDSHVL